MVCQRVVAAQHPDRLALSADPLCFCVARWGRRPSRTWRAVTVALADGEAVELAAPVALGPRDRARLAATKQTAKDTAGTTAVGRHPPKFREPFNKRILTRAKCNYAKPGEEIELIFEDGGFNATKSQRTASGALRELEAENKFLDLLRKTRTQGRYVNEA